nr:Eco57I restriction-modification methylase domain-containing protein [Candidatus Sigynarchaeota archaeon]
MDIGEEQARRMVDAWFESIVKAGNHGKNVSWKAFVAQLVLKLLVIRLAWDYGLVTLDVESLLNKQVLDRDSLKPVEFIGAISTRLDSLLDELHVTFSLVDDNLASCVKNGETEQRDWINDVAPVISSFFDRTKQIPARVADWFYEHKVVPQNQKNTKGIAYTPEVIVQYIVDAAVTSQINRLKERLKLYLERGDKKEKTNVLEKIASFSVLDPACGSGHFILYVQERLLEQLDSDNFLANTSNTDRSMDRIETVMNIVTCQLHGIDEDPNAVALARFLLVLQSWKELARYVGGLPLDVVDRIKARLIDACERSIVVGNALISPKVGDDNEALFDGTKLRHEAINVEHAFPHVFQNGNGGFNAIIGNPPYVNYKKYLSSLDRTFLERRYRVFNGQADLSYYFFEVHHDWLVAGGTSSQITSRYFMEGSHATRLRDLLERHEIVEIVDLNEVDVFPDLGIHAAIITWRKKEPNPKHQIDVLRPASITGLNNGHKKHVMQASISSHGAARGWVLLSDKEMVIKKKFDAWPALGSLGTCIGGSETGLDEAFVRHVYLDEKNHAPVGIVGNRHIPLEPALVHAWVKNGDIDRWWFKSTKHCIHVPPEMNLVTLEREYPGVHAFLSCFKNRLESRDNGRISVPWYVWRRPRNVKNLNVPAKIVMPYKAGSMRAAIDTGRHFCSYDVTTFIPNVNCPDLRYVLAVLNAKVTWWYFNTFGKRMGKIMELYPGPVSNIRVPIAPPHVQARACQLVDQLVALISAVHSSKSNASSEERAKMVSLTNEIDEMVVGLVGLTNDEIKEISLDP